QSNKVHKLEKGRMLGPFCEKNFTTSQFLPLHDDPNIFICSQWQRNKSKPNFLYLTYRTLVALFFLGTWISSMKTEEHADKWPIFLTNWGYTICTLQIVLNAVMLWCWVLSTRLKDAPMLKEKSLKMYPVYWLLNTISTPVAIGITITYWTVVYNPNEMKFNFTNYYLHANNSIMMIIDLLLTAHPVKVLHFVYPMIFAFAYSLFSWIYYAAGGKGILKDKPRSIYKILDWDKPLTTTLTCLGIILFLVSLYFLICLISKGRHAVYEKWCQKYETDNHITERKENGAYVNEGMSNDVV
ncbi:hypothetical protein NQ317_019197, partial [Molorchus minor]